MNTNDYTESATSCGGNVHTGGGMSFTAAAWGAFTRTIGSPLPVPRDVIEKALRRAYTLGQRYWQQADSESWKQNKMSDETQRAFEELIEETCTGSSDTGDKP